jgi:hypothetical protein
MKLGSITDRQLKIGGIILLLAIALAIALGCTLPRK